MLNKINSAHQPMVLNITVFDYPAPSPTFCYRNQTNDFCVRFSASDGFWYLHCNGEIVSCKAGYPIAFFGQHHAETFAHLRCFFDGAIDLPSSEILN